MSFSDEVREADLFWRAGELSTWLDDRLNSGEERRDSLSRQAFPLQHFERLSAVIRRSP